MQRIVLVDFRAVRGRGREVIELIVLPRRRRVRQEPRIKLPFFEGEITTYKTALRLPVLAALAHNCKHLSSAEKEWFRAVCAAQSTGYRGVGEFLRDYSRQGRGCFGFGGDIKDAYRQIGVRAEDLYQQVSAAWDNDGKRYFFLELCGKFGQVSAGDNFARFMALLRIIAEHLPGQAAVLFDNYVDNLVSQAKDGRVASKRLQRLKDFFSSIGIELHEVFCGQQYSFLGWDIDGSMVGDHAEQEDEHRHPAPGRAC
eukprot:g55661.t1